jgi:hypothetical protein
MCEGLGKDLTRKMGERLENHLSDMEPLHEEEEILHGPVLAVFDWRFGAKVRWWATWVAKQGGQGHLPEYWNGRGNAGSFDDAGAVKERAREVQRVEVRGLKSRSLEADP